ncbi:sulfate reduction electron transfer complex DsrMKJOP subunit DsrO [Desulfovibrio inopinatus]|uniref:sulfate reduction electron transfer complex DsrMKJOP subunit DsrO n=1 Tax=Desulfovibrio inopinatus TaxID=102109 RepID=UPI0003F5B029|nr:4Fe-4S dicluster domain-containing protein [Desulfovibrio inopinatus]
MKKDRRTVLKMAGVAALGVGAAKLSFLADGTAQASEAKSTVPTVENFQHPLKAEQWSFVVFANKMTPEIREKMAHACHSIHNVPNIPTKQNIKWLWSAPFEQAFPNQHNHHLAEGVEENDYLLLCNHCEQPPCVRVCPTQATFKDPRNGIVKMDWHRCIGCRYCMAGCPYGARSFNFQNPRPFIEKINPTFPTRTRGVVEKCTFCSERLAQGLAPACVEASEGTMIFGDLKDPKSEVREALKEHFTIRRKPDAGTQPCVYYVI